MESTDKRTGLSERLSEARRLVEDGQTFYCAIAEAGLASEYQEVRGRARSGKADDLDRLVLQAAAAMRHIEWERGRVSADPRQPVLW